MFWTTAPIWMPVGLALGITGGALALVTGTVAAVTATVTAPIWMPIAFLTGRKLKGSNKDKFFEEFKIAQDVFRAVNK